MFGMSDEASEQFREQFPGALTFIMHFQLVEELNCLKNATYTLSAWQQKRLLELRAWKTTYNEIMGIPS